FYTTDADEAQASVANGYAIEDKFHMYIYPTQTCGSVPLYRSHSTLGTDHFYTIDATERDDSANTGWVYQEIAGYV
ncbi:hypothetical protein B0H17DRAFT_898997, partial [Mycena rosella]